MFVLSCLTVLGVKSWGLIPVAAGVRTSRMAERHCIVWMLRVSLSAHLLRALVTIVSRAAVNTGSRVSV